MTSFSNIFPKHRPTLLMPWALEPLSLTSGQQAGRGPEAVSRMGSPFYSPRGVGCCAGTYNGISLLYFFSPCHKVIHDAGYCSSLVYSKSLYGVLLYLILWINTAQLVRLSCAGLPYIAQTKSYFQRLSPGPKLPSITSASFPLKTCSPVRVGLYADDGSRQGG